jgi:hypothetical protein
MIEPDQGREISLDTNGATVRADQGMEQESTVAQQKGAPLRNQGRGDSSQAGHFRHGMTDAVGSSKWARLKSHYSLPFLNASNLFVPDRSRFLTS